ncbi:hypothetical protein [Deinococcus yavapaiensis]|uniref:Uncharacterized protein n=1 Tax=Deinococcus yavapaiensis KR-236 TaxID=694435 RepID=A0A318S710_9DEIO|nr:hypothetical protein [Deinococcus yavapaiensis]PYE50970.1 hypothetical protein DES52_11637 [Deinococcus yavapaiensis KR-236]
MPPHFAATHEETRRVNDSSNVAYVQIRELQKRNVPLKVPALQVRSDFTLVHGKRNVR